MSKPSNKGSKPSDKPTPNDVARIQGAVARQHDGKVPKDSYVGRIQRTVATANGKHENQ